MLYSRAAHEPRVFEHVPGISNTIVDALSRLCEPGVTLKLPPPAGERDQDHDTFKNKVLAQDPLHEVSGHVLRRGLV